MRSNNARVERSALPLPHPWRYWITLGVLLAILIVSIYGTGTGWRQKNKADWRFQPLIPPDWLRGRFAVDGLFTGLNAILGWLNVFFDGVAGLILGHNGTVDTVPSSIRFCVLAQVLAVLLVLRAAWIRHIAYLPGPVEVRLLEGRENKPPPGAPQTPSLRELTDTLRERLAATSMYPPTAGTEPPAADVLDLVGDIDPTPGNLAKSILRLLTRIRPTTAYQVSGSLQSRMAGPRFGMTVTIASPGWKGCRATTVWANDWEGVVTDAAYWVVSSILPVTRLSHRPPWTEWVGRDLPKEVFGAYQQASSRAQERRFDEAMHHYHAALRQDPFNPYLRYGLARIQMSCGLYIDALHIIQEPLVFNRKPGFGDQQPDEDYADRLRRRFPRRYASTYLWYLLRHPWTLEVRYTYASLLGYFDHLPEQWAEGLPGTTEPAPGDRAHRRQELREGLGPVLAQRYWWVIGDLIDRPCAHETHADYEQRAKRYLEELLTHGFQHEEQPPQQPTETEKLVRLIFQRAYQVEMRLLTTDLAVYRMFRWIVPSRQRTSLTLTSLRICRDLVAPLRERQAFEAWPRTSPRPTAAPELGSRVKGFPGYTPATSPPADPDRLNKKVDRYLRFSHAGLHWTSLQWQDHYNAACVYALAFLSPQPHLDGDSHTGAGAPDRTRHDEASAAVRDTLAHFTVVELGAGLRCAESAYTTVTTDARRWMIEGDPDLKAVRTTDRFTRFANAVYPSEDHHRPGSGGVIHRVALADEELLTRVAFTMEQIWHRRGRQVNPDIHLMLKWVREEAEIWEELHTVAVGNARCWPSRYSLQHMVEQAADADADADKLPERARRSERFDNRLSNTPTRLPHFLAALSAKTPADAAGSPITCAARWQAALAAADAAGRLELPTAEAEALCRAYATVWQRLGEWSVGAFDGDGAHTSELAFTAATQQLPSPL